MHVACVRSSCWGARESRRAAPCWERIHFALIDVAQNQMDLQEGSLNKPRVIFAHTDSSLHQAVRKTPTYSLGTTTIDTVVVRT